MQSHGLSRLFEISTTHTFRSGDATMPTSGTLEEIRATHQLANVALLEAIKTRTGLALDEKILTIGFARRAATYKRFDFAVRSAGAIAQYL